jgi:CRISPR/Cas system-associated exonuclease Cas4 (RecB family)
MDTYEKCPKKYHYRYIEKPDVPQNKWGFTEFGSCAHMVLELFHKKIMENKVDKSQYSIIMKESFKTAVKEFDLNMLEDPVWTPDGDKSGLIYLREIMQVYLNNIKANGMPNVIGVEMPFNFKIDKETLVRGFIDRVDKVGPGEYHVVDYKTSKNPKYLSSFQLLVYSEALRRRFKDVKVVHGSFVMLKHDCKSYDYTFTLDDLKDCERSIVKKAGFIDTDITWVKKPSILCRWCDYRAICQDAWAE